MTINELNNKLTQSLKSFIKTEGFVDSGKLVKSIKFKCTYKDFDLSIKLDSLEYINYLDNGKLLSNFFKLNSTTEIIQEFYSESIEDSL